MDSTRTVAVNTAFIPERFTVDRRFPIAIDTKSANQTQTLAVKAQFARHEMTYLQPVSVARVARRNQNRARLRVESGHFILMALLS